MKKIFSLFLLTLGLTTLPTMALVQEAFPDTQDQDSSPEQTRAPITQDNALKTKLAEDKEAGRAALLQAYPLIQNDSIEKSFDYLYQKALHRQLHGDSEGSYRYLLECRAIDSTRAEVWSALAPLYHLRKNRDSLVICVEKAYRYDPQNKAYLLNLVNIYSQDDKLEQAAKMMEDYVAKHPKEYDYYYSISNLYKEAEMYEDAIRVLKQLEKIEGKNQEISLAVYNCYRRLGQPKKALKEMKDLHRSEPENTLYQVLLAYSYEDVNPEKSISMYQKIIREKEDNERALLFLADLYSRLDRKEDSESIFQAILNNGQVDFRNKYSILEGHYLKEYAKDSILIHNTFENLLTQYPLETALHKRYAAWLRNQKWDDLAAKHLRTAIDLHPYDMDAWIQYLSVYIDRFDLDNIKRLSEEAMQYFPEEYIFVHYASLVYSMEEDFDKVLELYRKGIMITRPEQNVQMSRILGSMGDIYHQLGDMDSCYHYYDQALLYNANNVLVLNNYAYFLSLENRELDKAEQMSQAAVRIEGNNATYLDTYAWVCFKKGNYAMAKIYIERALLNEQLPSVEILEHYGDILWFCNEKEKAIEQWNKALQLMETPSERLLLKTSSEAYAE